MKKRNIILILILIVLSIFLMQYWSKKQDQAEKERIEQLEIERVRLDSIEKAEQLEIERVRLDSIEKAEQLEIERVEKEKLEQLEIERLRLERIEKEKTEKEETSFTWHTDVNKAINVSVKQEKPLLFFFTGSDWCGWCVRLQKAVFAKPEFKSWATKNVVLVELDFPRRTKLPAKLEKQNRELQQLFGVRGYPTIWFVTVQQEEGKINFNKLGTQGASPLDAKGWIAGAAQILKNK